MAYIYGSGYGRDTQILNAESMERLITDGLHDIELNCPNVKCYIDDKTWYGLTNIPCPK